MLYAKELTITLDEVKKNTKNQEVNQLQGLKFDDNDKGLNVSRRKGTSRGNRLNSIGGGKLKYKCFNCHQSLQDGLSQVQRQ